MDSNQRLFIDQVRDLVDRYLDCCSDVSSWISCLSALETGYGSSRIFTFNHNLFGMKKPNFRLSCANVVNQFGHAVYKSSDLSVIDFVYWLIAFGFSSSDVHHLDYFVSRFSSSRYNPNMSSYIEKINSIYHDYSFLP